MREKFEAFLKEQGVYDEYMNRAKTNLGEEELESMFLVDAPSEWILCAFNWGDPDYGYLEDVRKWIHLDNLWNSICVA